MGKRKFYHNGLYFTCTECGNCCTDTSGYVELTEEEAGKIAKFWGLSETEFLEKFIEVPGNAASLHLISHQNGDCIFLVENRCSVYLVRPLQCRTFPFWPENVKFSLRWEITAALCPGINQGRLYPETEIENILDLMRKKG
jgi:Fe-S-cluster containining protein